MQNYGDRRTSWHATIFSHMSATEHFLYACSETILKPPDDWQKLLGGSPSS